MSEVQTPNKKKKRQYIKFPAEPKKKMEMNFTYMVEYLEANPATAAKWFARYEELLAANGDSKPAVSSQNTVLKEWIEETFPQLCKQKKVKKPKEPTLYERLKAAAQA